MSYFELLEQFWRLDSERTISASASKLYFYLLNEFNIPRWPAKIYRRANQVYADLNIDKKSLATAIAALEERGLIRHLAGNTSRAAEWLLNYGPAAEWSGTKGKNSPQEAEAEGKNSPSFGTTEAEWSGTKGNFSPPIRNRPDQIEDQPKKRAGEAAEEITHAPLPAKKEVSAPRCEAPPLSGSVELPEALATEAKQLATTIGQLWKISEITNYTKWARIAAFTKRLAQLGQLAQVTQQFAGYKLQREKAGLRPHSLDTWLGTYADDFANGEWCGCDWAAVAADTRTRPGEALSTVVPTRAATSPTKARANNWS